MYIYLATVEMLSARQTSPTHSISECFSEAFFTLYLVEFKTMMSRRQFFKLERHLWLHAFVWGRVSGYVFAFSLCLREKETDSPFVELHISRDRVPCESRERDPDRGARLRERVGPAV